jgi:hypothetical protein
MSSLHASTGPRPLRKQTRCLAPARGREPGPCWRPWGHTAGRHMTRDAYLRKLAQNRGYRARSARPLKPCGTYPAYKRHLRAREVPCKPCLAAASTAAARYRVTWLARELPADRKMSVPGERVRT